MDNESTSFSTHYRCWEASFSNQSDVGMFVRGGKNEEGDAKSLADEEESGKKGNRRKTADSLCFGELVGEQHQQKQRTQEQLPYSPQFSRTINFRADLREN